VSVPLSHSGRLRSAEDEPRQPGVDAGGPLLRVGGGAAQGGTEGADGGERLAGLLSLGEVVAEVRDGERVVQVGGECAAAFGEAPQLEQERAKTREIGLRPLARRRGGLARRRARSGAPPPRPRSAR